MSEAKGQQEPSMEEILASIRRIIAEDSDVAKPPINVEPETLPVEEEDVLELTEVVADEPELEPEPEPEPEPYRPPPKPRRPEPQLAVDLYLGNGAATVEEIVRELLRPMLREWLDANLPTLVERLVNEEIKRIAREAL
jgi:cell pole-organizing protein PopZ